MTTFLKQLICEMNLSEEDINYAEIVNKKLQKASKMDEIDTVTFGLETDDEKIVKVYVKVDKADKFEQLMSQKLGQIDSIEDALNEVAQEDSEIIVDVEWPDEEISSNKTTEEDFTDDLDDLESDENQDGSESLEKSVYDNEAEEDDKEVKIKRDESFGERFTNKLLKENEDNVKEQKNKTSRSLSKLFTTVQQKIVYQTILELGIPEHVLASSINRSSVINGIRTAAEELEGDSSRLNLLKTFNKKSVEESENVSTEEILLEGMNRDNIRSFIEKLILMLDKDFPNVNPNGTASRLVNNTANFDNFFNRLQSSSLTRLNPATSQFNILTQKLLDITNKLEQNAKNVNKEVNTSGIKESVNYVVVQDIPTPTWKSNIQMKQIIESLDKETLSILEESIVNKKVVSIKSIDSTDLMFRPETGKLQGLIKIRGSKECYNISLTDIKDLLDV